jgi:ABC transport system ATP-binding/permease protein
VLLVSHDRDFLDRVVTSVIASEGNGRWVEYAGGYTDMLAQRRAAAAASPAMVQRQPRTAPRAKAGAATPSRRMSYNDHRALEMLPARITSLQARVDVLTSALADPDLYARDAAQFNNTTSALAAARDELLAAEEQWLSLEMLREEIDGA